MSDAEPAHTSDDAAAVTVNRRCAACGAGFHCGAGEATCWCVSLPALPASAIDATTGCLCPACLRARVDATAGHTRR